MKRVNKDLEKEESVKKGRVEQIQPKNIIKDNEQQKITNINNNNNKEKDNNNNDKDNKEDEYEGEEEEIFPRGWDYNKRFTETYGLSFFGKQINIKQNPAGMLNTI